MEHSLQRQSCLVQVARNLLEKYSWRIEISLLRPGRPINPLGSAGRSSAPGFSRVQNQKPSARNCSSRGDLFKNTNGTARRLTSLKPIHRQFLRSDYTTSVMSNYRKNSAGCHSKEKQWGGLRGFSRGRKQRN